ncbi:MAG: hypothetical protein D3M94_07925 [Rhodocyclales bacterium GT-UBC]|nr:MAG: hypothetical protein D3M94_07925 [Rhodocyclales bacterium GT-UBC]
MNANHADDLKESETDCTISKRRQLVALEASWEIEQMCKLLRTCVQPNDSNEHYAVRGLTARIQELNSIFMSALGDAMETTSELAHRLRLEHEEAA